MSSDKYRKLTLDDLRAGLPGGITPSIGSCLAEASAVCLESQRHCSGVLLQIAGNFDEAFEIYWSAIEGRAQLAWNDLEEATEFGACGIACLLIPSLTSMTVIERSRKGTGFDYWLGNEVENKGIFQKKARLEVSGIRIGDDSIVRARVNQKLRQTERSDGVFPAYVIIVEFSKPISQVVIKNV